MVELNSDMPGTEEFAGREMEELGRELPRQGEAPTGGAGSQKADGGKAVGEQGGQGAQAAPGGSGAPAQGEQPAEMSTPDLKAEVAELRTRLDQAIRENRGYAALKSQVARLENELKARGAAPVQPSTLTPEQQSQADAQKAAEEYLKKFLADNLDPLMRERYGKYLETLERQQSNEAQIQFKGSVEQLAKDMNIPFESKNADDFPLNPILGRLINADMAAYETDPAAKARIDRILNTWDHNELFMRALKERSALIQAQGARVQQQQQRSAQGGGRALKPGGAKPDEKPKYNAEELGAMSEEDRERAFAADPEAFEAAIPKQGRR